MTPRSPGSTPRSQRWAVRVVLVLLVLLALGLGLRSAGDDATLTSDGGSDPVGTVGAVEPGAA